MSERDTSGSIPPPLTRSPASGLTGQVEGIWRRLRQQEFTAAHDAARALLTHYPGNRDVLYVLAVSLRCDTRIADALEVLKELERHSPRYGRLFEERGLCHLARHETEAATAAFEHGITLNPWLLVSLKSLEGLYRAGGRMQEAEVLAQRCAALERLPAPLRAAHSLVAEGEIHAAERVIGQFLLSHPDDVEGMRLLARLSMSFHLPHDPEALLARVLRAAPDYHAARYDYAVALLNRHRHLEARGELEKLLASDPENRACRLAHATACASLGDHAGALAEYQSVLAQAPGDAEVHLAVGHVLKTMGRTSEAVDSFRTAASVRPGLGYAYWSLADLKTYRFEDAVVEQLIGQEADPQTTSTDRYHLAFALGKALEDRGEYESSFQYYARGNELKRLERRYSPEFHETMARLQVATCTREFFAAREGWGYAEAAPIFIVGLPRVGSTLIEQILASHSQVDGTMELPAVPHLVYELHDRTRPLDNPRYPGVLAELTRDECLRLGERYDQETLAYRHGRALFIDKWPNNFWDLGLICLILPHARIIDARRDPVACGFSIFKQLFPSESGPEFAYSFEDIARYYRMYLQLMEHWNAVLPGRILRVQYEELVTEFSASVPRILEFCNLEPEPACFEFYKTTRAVHSPSSEQVRQPINRTGLDQWRRFEPWLAPLREALARFEVVTSDSLTRTTPLGRKNP